ncbi:MAG: hypothetical protein ACYS21_00350 [Planctomycetota bacterium]|jgi:hypothetical protein
MNENQGRPENLLDTTDCLEAVGIFRGWKNFLFIITILCLLLLQVSFWAVDLGLVTGEEVQGEPPPATSAAGTSQPNIAASAQTASEADEITAAARKVTTDANVSRVETPLDKPAEPVEANGGVLPWIEFRHLAWLIRLLDFVLILAAMLYCLTMLFSLKISLLGRLGGINHISRAFFLSLIFVVLLLPWQKLFGPVVKGAIFTPGELATWVKWCNREISGIFTVTLYYLRFTGYWVLVMLFLIFSMLRSNNWIKATLRRLEVI